MKTQGIAFSFAGLRNEGRVFTTLMSIIKKNNIYSYGLLYSYKITSCSTTMPIIAVGCADNVHQ